MAKKSFPVEFTLKAIDRVTAPLRKFGNEVSKLQNPMRRFNESLRKSKERNRELIASLNRTSKSFSKLGRDMTYRVSAPIVALGALSVRSFAQFEQGVIDVRKTTGLATDEIQKMMFAIGERTPIAHAALLEIAGAAGQLGVKGADNIEKFTETFAKLEKASDIAGEDGAKAVVRLLDVTGDGVGAVDKFSSALVALGNNFAASESEILHMGTRVGLATSQFNIGSQSVLGIATAMKSLGIQAEAGGTVIGKTFRGFQAAIDGGGKQMQVLSKITGMTSEQIKKTFKTDATAVFTSFIEGLARLDKEGISTTRALKAFGLQGDRLNAVIPTMVQRSEKLSEALGLSRVEFEKNAALEEEFAEQRKSFNSKMIAFMNVVNRLATQVGTVLAPAIEWATEKLSKMIKFFSENPTILKMSVAFAGFLAVLGPAVWAIGGLIAAGAKLIPILSFIWTGVKMAGAAIAIFTSPVWGTVAAFAAVAAIIARVIYKWQELKNAWASGQGFFDTIKKLGSTVLGFGDVPNIEGADAGASLSPKDMAIQSKTISESNASVNVKFANLPKGSRVSSSSSKGVNLSVEQGLSMFQGSF